MRDSGAGSRRWNAEHWGLLTERKIMRATDGADAKRKNVDHADAREHRARRRHRRLRHERPDRRGRRRPRDQRVDAIPDRQRSRSTCARSTSARVRCSTACRRPRPSTRIGRHGHLSLRRLQEDLLQAEAGLTRNEPAQICVNEAIEIGAHAPDRPGRREPGWVLRTWDWYDPTMQRYLQEDRKYAQDMEDANTAYDPQRSISRGASTH